MHAHIQLCTCMLVCTHKTDSTGLTATKNTSHETVHYPCSKNTLQRLHSLTPFIITCTRSHDYQEHGRHVPAPLLLLCRAQPRWEQEQEQGQLSLLLEEMRVTPLEVGLNKTKFSNRSLSLLQMFQVGNLLFLPLGLLEWRSGPVQVMASLERHPLRAGDCESIARIWFSGMHPG